MKPKHKLSRVKNTKMVRARESFKKIVFLVSRFHLTTIQADNTTVRTIVAIFNKGKQ